MLRVTAGLALALVLLDAGAVRAQIVWCPPGHTTWRQWSGYGFALGGRNWAVSGFAGNSYGFVMPAWGPVLWQPPVVIVPVVVRPPASLIDRDTLLSRVPNLTPEPVPDRWPGAAERVEDQVRRGNLLVINPRGNGVQPIAPPLPPRAAERPDPAVLAREAFVEGWYGRAAELFATAITAEPQTAQLYFLLAQARTARSDYAGAVAAIQIGMTHAPDWPARKFDLRAVYGPNVGAFDEHIAELRRAALAAPDDPTLGFLLGYHLWFLGEKAEAVKLFRRAAKQVKDGAVIERFLVEADVKT